MAAGRHFHTFDALRFMAFFKVFLTHTPVAGFALLDLVKPGGVVAVRFFFVLSGFLITYLILAEKEQTGRLNFRYFMVRRILRIWPLYYLIVAFAFLTPYILTALHVDHSEAGYVPNFLFTVTFLENYVGIAKHEPPNVSPLGVIWSVCVEEHFYVVWGLALWYLRTRHVPRLIAFSLVLAVISRSVFVALDYRTLDLLTNIDLFAMGAAPAYLLTTRGDRLIAWVDGTSVRLKRLYAVLVVAGVLVASNVSGALVEVIGPSVLGVLFGGLLTLLLSPRLGFGISDSNILSKLGKYTYGLYFYHVIVLNALSRVFLSFGWNPVDLPAGLPHLLLSLSASVALSAISYHWFERPFLDLKRYASPRARLHEPAEVPS
jgi:peptidoglycan/LPS O-acetylase OafA/YrhL